MEWISHINHVARKPNKRSYFLVLLKHAKSMFLLNNFTISLRERSTSTRRQYCNQCFITLYLHINVTSLSVFKSVLSQSYLLDLLIRTILSTSISILLKTNVIICVKLCSRNLFPRAVASGRVWGGAAPPQ